MRAPSKPANQLAEIRHFYDATYYGEATPVTTVCRHLSNLALKIGIRKNQQVLDVACGTGEWLLACQRAGALPNGVDLSAKAIDLCKKTLASGEFHATPAESLPFGDGRFDVVTCLGSLEHFVEPERALREMVRVAKPDATVVILVPNADFLTRRLGLFAGTYQVDAKEEVRTLSEWERLFADAGLVVEARWKDLHVLNWEWISRRPRRWSPLRAAQALALVAWPMRWQYQVYHCCRIRKTD